MPSISGRLLADAVLRVQRMSFNERDRLVDEIHDRQPNLFFTVLVLQRYGASFEQIEVVPNLLFVFCEAMRISGRAWPVISEDAPGAVPASHPEQQLLAYIFGTFRERRLVGVDVIWL